MHKILKDFEIQADYPILVRKSDIVLINQKKISYYLVDFAVFADHRVKIEKVKR